MRRAPNSSSRSHQLRPGPRAVCADGPAVPALRRPGTSSSRCARRAVSRPDPSLARSRPRRHLRVCTIDPHGAEPRRLQWQRLQHLGRSAYQSRRGPAAGSPASPDEHLRHHPARRQRRQICNRPGRAHPRQWRRGAGGHPEHGERCDVALRRPPHPGCRPEQDQRRQRPRPSHWGDGQPARASFSGATAPSMAGSCSHEPLRGWTSGVSPETAPTASTRVERGPAAFIRYVHDGDRPPSRTYRARVASTRVT